MSDPSVSDSPPAQPVSDLPGGGAAAAGPFRGADDEGWVRVHPLTPWIKSWQLVAVAIFFVVHQLSTNLPDALSRVRDLGEVGTRGLLLGGAVLALAAVAVIALAILSWRMTRYRIAGDRLELRAGVLFRQHKLAQLDRIQAVDISQPLLARIAGLSRLTVEVAGSGSSKFELAYLSDDTAKEVRNRLLAGSAGLDLAPDRPAPEAAELHSIEVPIGRLLASILLSPLAIVMIVFLLASLTEVVTRTVGLAAMLPALVGLAGGVWSQFAGGFGFRVASSPDGVRVRRGLLEQRNQTVPPGRVQAVSVHQPWLWRRFGWWRVEVNVAGYGKGSSDAEHSTSRVLPVGTRDEAAAVLWFVSPDLGEEPGEQPGALLDLAMTGQGDAGGFVTSPPPARWLDPLAWRRNGFRITRTALLIRSGALRRAVTLVPHERTQSLGAAQGPLQRRLGLASFALHSTPGPISPRVPHLAESVVAQLLEDQAERARQARATARPERWMQPGTGSAGSGA